MFKHLSICFLFLFIASTASSQEKAVVQKHPDGSPRVIVYSKGVGKIQRKVKEEVFYENGQLEYVGEYRNGKEHGSWVYYYKDGTIEAEEWYEDGLEEGIHKEYTRAGILRVEKYYSKGKLLKTVPPDKN